MKVFAVYALVVASALVAVLAAHSELNSGSALVCIVGKLVSAVLWVIAFVLVNENQAVPQAAMACVLLILMTVFLWAVATMPFCVFTATCFSSPMAKHLFFLVALVCGFGSFTLFTKSMEAEGDMQIPLDLFNTCVWLQVLLYILYYLLTGGWAAPIAFLMMILHCLQIVGAGYLLLTRAHKTKGLGEAGDAGGAGDAAPKSPAGGGGGGAEP